LINWSQEEIILIELNVAIKNKHYANNNVNRNNTVLAQVDFSVERGEFVAIIGPSGCGKTTLLNMISGIEKCDGHLITYDKNDEKKQEPYRVGYIFQQPRLMPWLTVRENIALVLQSNQYDQIELLLTQVGLAGKGEYFPRQLSGGMQRRVSIARAFAINPHLLLLDEPFNSLDAPTANRLRQLLIDLCKQRGTTVVFVTHDLQEAIYLADRIIFLSDSPCTIIHESIIDLPKPRTESGIAELAFQAKLMREFPLLLAGKLD
jgi:NitT/TauT family transport system ATP-binding protein